MTARPGSAPLQTCGGDRTTSDDIPARWHLDATQRDLRRSQISLVLRFFAKTIDPSSRLSTPEKPTFGAWLVVIRFVFPVVSDS